VTLAALAPRPGEFLWDVGAGCGSIAIEWLRTCPHGRAVAIERDRARAALIAENAAALGSPQLDLVIGDAPASLDGLAAPDAVFIGGGISGESVFEAAWKALKPGGRLVANAVTPAGEARLAQLHNEFGGDLRRIAISRAETRGQTQTWTAKAPVTQWNTEKK
jgi:precorrin-6Y C5,15-methyltransferase (decarboxylating)